MKEERIIIIGNGVAGITTARHLRKRSNCRITVISSESKHFFSRTALMYIYMGHMKYEHTKPYSDDFWEKNRIELLQARVDEIQPNEKQLKLADGETLSYDKLVIATGSKTATYGWKGLELEGVQGLYSLHDLQQMEINTKGIQNAVVVGGGLIGVEMAEMLHSRGIHVKFLVREDRFWGSVLPKEEGELIGNHLISEGIELRYQTELDEIIGEGKVQTIKTKSGETINCDFVGICTGVKPNVDFLRNSALEIDKGILVDEYLQTNLPDIYAAGDCAQLRNARKGRKAIEAVWYVGKMMGEVLGATLAGSPTKYNPGHWFNSAKFFQIEYQTYGEVPANLSSGQASLYWQASQKEKALRVVYESESRKLIGIHAFGIRLSHPQCDSWLKTGIQMSELINELPKANFDPEFYENPFPEVQQTFSRQLKEPQL
ncbi:MAG: FAD-dependent oxidoreductase [Flavobacteriales bacterium]|mgnify:CR=1 FL=1|nr:FAD-dependent oxidoreductase [Flavobacteriales bacterium]